MRLMKDRQEKEVHQEFICAAGLGAQGGTESDKLSHDVTSTVPDEDYMS